MKRKIAGSKYTVTVNYQLNIDYHWFREYRRIRSMFKICDI